MRRNWLASLLVLAGCPDVSTDSNDKASPYVEFDPANSIIPFPNNLVLSPTTGRVSIPAGACESAGQAAVRTNVLNKLDGFGSYEAPITVTLSEAPDPATVAGSVHLYKRAPVASTTEIPTVSFVNMTPRFDPADCTAAPVLVPEIVVVPKVPLDSNSTYTLAVVDGLNTAAGKPYKASFTWGLVRQSMDPVTLADGCDRTTLSGCIVTTNRTPIPEPTSDSPSDPSLYQLVGIDTLWQAHAMALAFLDTTTVLTANRANLLVATDFTTQSTVPVLDPTVATSPAGKLTGGHLTGVYSIPSAAGANCSPGNGCTNFMTAVGIPCGSIPCNAVGDILGAGLIQGGNMYQVPLPNAFAPSMQIPGAWTDPINPTVQGPWQKTGAPPAGVLEVLAFIPDANNFPGPWPTVVFQHGLTRHKEDLFAIGAQLASIGFASVAIDLQLHGSRAIPTSNDPTLGCAGTCFTAGGTDTGTACDTLTACAPNQKCINGISLAVEPTSSPQCYAQLISTNLDATRDSIRQSVLDQLLLIKALEACGATNCAPLGVQADHIVYVGQSLGSIVGAITNAETQDTRSVVLNVSGVGVADILETTPEQLFRSSYVNGLIAAGVLTGTPCSPSDPTVGLCANQDWLMQPAYQQFSAIERWILDPAEPANFVSRLGTRKVLQQEVIGDKVVPNPTSEVQAMLTGLTATMADPAASATPAPSVAITNDPTGKKWVQYMDLPAAGAFPGNSFAHGSLLAPATAGPDGSLGLVRMQTDAFTYLFDNK
jgi:hypothetical protein